MPHPFPLFGKEERGIESGRNKLEEQRDYHWPAIQRASEELSGPIRSDSLRRRDPVCFEVAASADELIATTTYPWPSTFRRKTRPRIVQGISRSLRASLKNPGKPEAFRFAAGGRIRGSA